MSSTASTTEILQILSQSYPTSHIALSFKSSWELLVAVILSAQCTDKKVNEVTAKLFEKYKTLDEYCSAAPSEFEIDIHQTGFFRAKTKNILKTAKIIKEKYNGEVPKTMKELVGLPGVARKTANVVLGSAHGVVEGIAVDTHVIRLSQRLRLVDLGKIGGKKKMTFEKEGRPARRRGGEVVDFIKDADPVKIEQELMKVIPQQDWFLSTYRIIDHGRAVCKAQNPKCGECVLQKLCPVSRV